MFFTKDMQAWGSLFLIIALFLDSSDLNEWTVVDTSFLVIIACVYLFMILKPEVSVFGRFDRAFPVFSSYFRSFGWVMYAFCAVIFILSLYGVLIWGLFRLSFFGTAGENASHLKTFLLLPLSDMTTMVIVWASVGSVLLSLIFRWKYGPRTEEVAVRPHLYQHLILAGMIFLFPVFPLLLSLLLSRCS